MLGSDLGLVRKKLETKYLLCPVACVQVRFVKLILVDMTDAKVVSSVNAVLGLTGICV